MVLKYEHLFWDGLMEGLEALLFVWWHRHTGLPCFCSSVCVQFNTWKRKSSKKTPKKQGRPGNTYDMNDVNDVRWTRGGHGGEEGSAIKYNILDFIIEPPVARKDPRHSHKIVSTPLDQ